MSTRIMLETTNKSFPKEYRYFMLFSLLDMPDNFKLFIQNSYGIILDFDQDIICNQEIDIFPLLEYLQDYMEDCVNKDSLEISQDKSIPFNTRLAMSLEYGDLSWYLNLMYWLTLTSTIKFDSFYRPVNIGRTAPIKLVIK